MPAHKLVDAAPVPTPFRAPLPALLRAPVQTHAPAPVQTRIGGLAGVSFIFSVVFAIGFSAVFSFSLLSVGAAVASAQDLPSPRVGGAGSLDSAPATSGDQGTPARHRLTPLTVIPEDFSTLKLAPGFLLSMDCYDAPELSSDLRVDDNGDVTIPMIGHVHVAGATLTQAASAIADRLREGKILNHPQINLNVAQYTGSSVTVLGEVHNPGRIELLAAHNLADVIAMSGGETQFAGNLIEIRHPAGATVAIERVHYSRSADDRTLVDTQVHPGDTVTMERAGIVYVLGGVNRPGGYVMQEGGELDLTQALALAYGTNMQAAVGSMHLIRKLGDGKVEDLPIPYRDIVKGKVAPPRLQAEDVVYVPISKTKTVLGAGLLATAATAAIYIH